MITYQEMLSVAQVLICVFMWTIVLDHYRMRAKAVKAFHRAMELNKRAQELLDKSGTHLQETNKILEAAKQLNNIETK